MTSRQTKVLQNQTWPYDCGEIVVFFLIEMSDSEEETATDHQLKFVLLGDGASGKVFVIVSHKVKLF